MNMKNKLLPLSIVTALFLIGSVASANQMSSHAGHESVTGKAAGSSAADVVKHKACHQCGMDREKFAHSRILITNSDGSTVGVCSIHCAVTELKANKGRAVKAIEVADLNTQKLLVAEKATWVIGGSRNGVMTQTPKWAFAQKYDAAAFVKKNGGKLATYKEALALAEKE
jgi:nitrous oxide reductase accessory protein NosL